MQEEEDAADFTASLASDMFHYQAQHMLAGQYMYDDWDPQLVRSWLAGCLGGEGRGKSCKVLLAVSVLSLEYM